MQKKIWKKTFLLFLIFNLFYPALTFAADKKSDSTPFTIPNHVLPIDKENTYTNNNEADEEVEASETTKGWIDGLKYNIDNQALIELLNETTIKPSPIAIGYRGMIYLGRWPIQYETKETKVNWEYQKVHENEWNNIESTVNQKLHYDQNVTKQISGVLTSKIEHADAVKQMMLFAARKKTDLPLTFQTTIGQGTKKENAYTIPPNKAGTLTTFVPAVYEKGQIVFGEVYVQLKGKETEIILKNVTKQGIAAWMPLQDYLTFSFQLKQGTEAE
ncbi:YfkD family protein [Ornithinibacillus sp. 4-3]|uniref:YfkD family protein n=1 Tax=Ornithinibacillus sp. 4-3 TaxID=3231488 RepID=A0AB39HNW9_9BACI